jgi:predicted RNA binding protein YcfA (HicA-like mRNA interferase family)
MLPKLPKLTPDEAESLLLKAGFELIRSKGSHRIYIKKNVRVVVPFHSNKILHPKIVKQIVEAVDINF